MEQPLKHEALEQDIARLSQEVRERQEKSGAEDSETAVRETLRKRIYSESQAAPASPSLGGPTPSAPVAGEGGASPILPAYLQKESPEMKLKVEELIDMTFHQGIDKAVAEARQYGPFVLDAFHDTLTSKMHEELKSRGLI